MAFLHVQDCSLMASTEHTGPVEVLEDPPLAIGVNFLSDCDTADLPPSVLFRTPNFLVHNPACGYGLVPRAVRLDSTPVPVRTKFQIGSVPK